MKSIYITTLICLWGCMLYGQGGTIEITNPTFPSCEDGSVTIEINTPFMPVSIFLSNGEEIIATNNTLVSFNNLSNGLYSFIIEDAICGVGTGYFELDCQCFKAEPTLEFSSPSNNQVNLFVSIPDFSDINGTVTLKLFDSFGNQVGTDKFISSPSNTASFLFLELGSQYCIEYEVGGCSFQDCFTVTGETCPFNISLKSIKMACSNNSDLGSIEISYSDLDCASLEISWDDGTSGPQIDDLNPGTYCVTIEGECQGEACLAVECFDIYPIICDDDCTITVDADIIPRYACSEYDKFGNGISRIYSGSISLSVSGGSGNYDFQWLNTNGGNGSNASISWWDQDLQCVIITDPECNYSEEFCFTVGFLLYPEEYCGKMKWFFSPELNQWISHNIEESLYDEVLENLISENPKDVISNEIWTYSFNYDLGHGSYKLTFKNNPTVFEYISLDRRRRSSRQEQLEADKKINSNPLNTNKISLSSDKKFFLFPNPTQGNFILNLTSEKSQYSEVNIYDITGREVFSQKLNVLEGLNHFNLNADKLETGTYIVRINGFKSGKLLILNN